MAIGARTAEAAHRLLKGGLLVSVHRLRHPLPHHRDRLVRRGIEHALGIEDAIDLHRDEALDRVVVVARRKAGLRGLRQIGRRVRRRERLDPDAAEIL